MKTIWKYQIRPNSVACGTFEIKLELPLNSTPLCVKEQGGAVFLWAEIDAEENRRAVYKLGCVGTGHGSPPNAAEASYFGTVINGRYVWHFYLYHGTELTR